MCSEANLLLEMPAEFQLYVNTLTISVLLPERLWRRTSGCNVRGGLFSRNEISLVSVQIFCNIFMYCEQTLIESRSIHGKSSESHLVHCEFSGYCDASVKREIERSWFPRVKNFDPGSVRSKFNSELRVQY